MVTKEEEKGKNKEKETAEEEEEEGGVRKEEKNKVCRIVQLCFPGYSPPKTKPVRETLGCLSCVFLNRIGWWSV